NKELQRTVTSQQEQLRRYKAYIMKTTKGEVNTHKDSMETEEPQLHLSKQNSSSSITTPDLDANNNSKSNSTSSVEQNQQQKPKQKQSSVTKAQKKESPKKRDNMEKTVKYGFSDSSDDETANRKESPKKLLSISKSVKVLTVEKGSR